MGEGYWLSILLEKENTTMKLPNLMILIRPWMSIVLTQEAVVVPLVVLLVSTLKW